MQPSIDFFAIANSAGAVQAVFWAVALLSIPKGKHAANRLLAALLFAFALGISVSIFYHTRYILIFPHLARLTDPLKFLYPPLFYLYVKALTSPQFRLRAHLFHFLPALFCSLYLLPFYLKDANAKVRLLQGSLDSGPDDIMVALVLLQEALYTVLTLRLWWQHSRQTKQVFSEIDRVNLRWIRNLVVAFLLVSVIYGYFETAQSEVVAKAIVSFSLTGFIFVMGYMGLKQPMVFLPATNGSSGQKYQKSGLTSEKAQQYLARLRQVMQDEKPYLESDLTLQTLAQRLSISPNHLSQLLNAYLKQSFFDFVNSYRVEAAKRLLRDPKNDHLTLLAVAYEAGFTSKSSFNSAFRKFAGTTPSRYKQSLPSEAD